MAQYSLFVLKVSLNTNQPTTSVYGHLCSWRRLFMVTCVHDDVCNCVYFLQLLSWSFQTRWAVALGSYH